MIGKVMPVSKVFFPANGRIEEFFIVGEIGAKGEIDEKKARKKADEIAKRSSNGEAEIYHVVITHWLKVKAQRYK